MTEFGVLGSLSLHRQGEPVALRASKLRQLLAVLLARTGHATSVEGLAEALWNGTAPSGHRRTIQVYIHRLRTALDHQHVVHGPTGYQILVTREQLDAFRFADLAERARAARDHGELARARELFTDALDLWRGPAYADIEPCHPLTGEVHRLGEQRLLAQQDLIEVELNRGRHAEVVTKLAELVDAHPYRERLRALHLLALHRSGRQAEALAAFRATRHALAEQLGMEPGALLQRLHGAMLQADERLALVATGSLDGEWEPVSRPPVLASPAVPRQLPGDVAGFTGRAGALHALDRLSGATSAPSAPVVITGSAGVGKTTLAVHWAHRVADQFPDGQLYVNLRGFQAERPPVEPAEALRDLLDGLQVRPQRMPAGIDALAGRYRSLLAERRMLVLLDDARDAAQVRPLLPGAAGCLAVVTSRNRLAGLVAAEGAHPLQLDLPTHAEARQLLAHRLGAGRLAADPAATDEIITRCSRLPLALAIVAARAVAHPTFPLDQLLRELREAELDALSDADPAVDIRAAFTASYRGLPTDAARLFRLLGLHPGPEISAAAAASLAGLPAPSARRLLASLTDAHLLTEPTPGRYAFHDLLRAYAIERAAGAATDRRPALHRMLDHYLHGAHTADRLLAPQDQVFPLRPPQPGAVPALLAGQAQAGSWFAAEHKALVRVVELAGSQRFDTHAWQLASCLRRFLAGQGRWHDLLATSHLGLRAARRAADRFGQAKAHQALGVAYAETGRPGDARRHYRQALKLYRHLGDEHGQASIHQNLGWLAKEQGDLQGALHQVQQAHRRYESAGHRAGQARARNAIGMSHALLGQPRAALIHCEQALGLMQEIDDVRGLPLVWDSLGYAHHQLGEHDQAIACYRQALGRYDRGESGPRRAETLRHLGDAYRDAGDLSGARDAWQQALTTLQAFDDPDTEPLCSRLRRLPGGHR